MLIFVLLNFLKIHYSVNGFAIETLNNYLNHESLPFNLENGDNLQLPNYEVVYLPTILEVEAENYKIDDIDKETIDYEFSAFEQPISLKLKRNEKLLSRNFKTYIKNGSIDEGVLNSYSKNCHYLHKDDSSIAAISICQPQSIQGIIILNNETFEIHPLSERLQNLVKLREPLLDVSNNYDTDGRIPHLIKRATLSSNGHLDDIFPIPESVRFINDHLIDNIKQNSNTKEAVNTRPTGGLTLEVALFFDETAYKIFAPMMDYDINKLQDMILAYLNGVQALYHQPSLGSPLEITLIRLDIMKKQPSKMYHHYGERSKLLDSFCEYQNSLNPGSDSDPDHWDMALYISGLDFYAMENGKKNGATMGLATVGGVCHPKYACIIAELGTTNIFGKPYPSAGFNSVYILAHEIGHNLGMHHDSMGNSCPKEGYIMSPSRGTNGETQWSSCSAKIMSKLSWATCLRDGGKYSKHLDHGKFLEQPGHKYTAKQQCEILLRDKDAVVSPNQNITNICYNLQCKTPHRSGYYFAGPALDGTNCGKKKICLGGECLSRSLPVPIQVIPGGWSTWKEGKCKSSCIEKSIGYTSKRRICNNPPPMNTDLGCEGSSIEFATCRDDKICDTRISAVQYASRKCREFSRVLSDLDPEGIGLQAPHEEERLWMGCTIFCKRSGSGNFYSPRIELNDLGISAYLPDGTLCHRKNNQNYYCMHHHCLPENFEFAKSASFVFGLGNDVPFSQNAHPNKVVPPEIEGYFSVDSNGNPLMVSLGSTKLRNEDWESNDYIEIPELTQRLI
ncbi:A disintegrin and metalloproteinase with thrombospondin motifs adt-2-like [Harmonia axyridis]|uniref:A disintegrin and metalloproteinase with thrombospondin motifs adt-2-like n=1 Tax=Harmonia axyridis TaxID=115357 RepID=UPI001E276555|nr:A disintegrin and metalloproteinase with thrombospondin motifs adt-2-like [Harmonia axyridis]